MKKKQEVILRFFRDGDSKSKISRDMKLHRQTVRDYIAAYLAELEKEKTKGTYSEGSLSTYVSEPPKYKVRTSPKIALTQEVCNQIDLYLEENLRKRREGMRKLFLLTEKYPVVIIEKYPL